MMKISTNNHNYNNNSHNHNNNNTNEEPGKIFIGGLTRTTTKEMLENEFLKYGDIIQSIIMKNNETGQSRGFGFVTFKDPQSANIATNSVNKLDGKIIGVKLCNTKLAAEQRQQKLKNENCKIFIGGLPHGVTDDEVHEFFQERYGPVKEFKMMYDDVKKRPRGFGFITFELEESANQVLLEHYITFKGKQIEVKPQVHNTKQQQQHHQTQFSWNSATAAIEPTWSTINSVVATAAANAYGNTPGVDASTIQQQQWPQGNWAAAGYYGGQGAPDTQVLNYYGQQQQQSQGYYQNAVSNTTNQVQKNDHDNFTQQQHQQQQQQHYSNTNIAQNQYYNHNHHNNNHYYNSSSSSTTNTSSNNNNNYNNSTSNKLNNYNNKNTSNIDTATSALASNTYNNHHTYSSSSQYQEQVNTNHYKHKDNQRQQQPYNNNSNNNSNRQQYHPYKR